MQASELRRAFTQYFSDRDHVPVDSASLIPHDPSLLFTVAGMVPFKPFFTGEEPAPYKRAVTVQKCVRAGGKHNDLDEIGRTLRHLTFFEMMGNFSFGDYFKELAIPMAWEFSTEVLGFDPEQLWVTVHLSDDQAEEIWRDVVGVHPDRIQRLDEDNYWRMADTGPCGPCSELFIDKGASFGDDGGPLNGGEERFLEFWNLVFMQFDQQADGQTPLPAPSIDTGAGLERILSLKQGVDSVFQTDELARLVDKAGELSKTVPGADPIKDVSLRILADHARSTTMLITDGVFPSNEDRGYVLRRIMRRAIRHAYLLGVEDIITPVLVDEVVDIMGDDYTELKDNRDFLRGVVEREEERFRQTLKTGSSMLDTEMEALDAGQPLSGSVAFALHDTYGFPLEVTEEIARERQVEVDLAGFEDEMKQQRERARAAHDAKGGATADLSEYQAVLESHGETDFVGRDHDEIDDAVVVLVTADGVVLDRTPFYAESGGQVGDTGVLAAGTIELEVTDTRAVVPGVTLHFASGAEAVFEIGQTVGARIDSERRDAIRRNHTGTHLLHYALRDVLGDHVKQQGSLVGPERLRFDFSHYEAVTAEQIAKIEDLVNADVLANPTTTHFETSMDEAKERGAIAFFGDKYGDRVRVLEAGPNSVELCGGTHVNALGDIGPLKIVSEGSTASNVRRIEAITGFGPIERLRSVEARQAEAAGALGVPVEDLIDGATKRNAEIKSLRDEIKKLNQQIAVGRSGELAAKAVDGVVIERVDGLDRDSLRDLAVAIRDNEGIRAAVLGSAPEGGGAALVAAVKADVGLHAGELIADASKLIKGGGGKGPDIAVAGGKDPEGIDEALAVARTAATS